MVAQMGTYCNYWPLCSWWCRIEHVSWNATLFALCVFCSVWATNKIGNQPHITHEHSKHPHNTHFWLTNACDWICVHDFNVWGCRMLVVLGDVWVGCLNTCLRWWHMFDNVHSSWHTMVWQCNNKSQHNNNSQENVHRRWYMYMHWSPELCMIDITFDINIDIMSFDFWCNSYQHVHVRKHIHICVYMYVFVDCICGTFHTPKQHLKWHFWFVAVLENDIFDLLLTYVLWILT